MVHKVIMFIDGIHFGLAIECQDGWYKFEYAADGAKLNGVQFPPVTIRRSAPTGN